MNQEVVKIVKENILTRRSVRAFTEQRIGTEDLMTIAKAGVHAPTGMNRQSWTFIVLNDKKKIHELEQRIGVALSRDGNYNFYGADAVILVSNDRENGNGIADTACAMENMFLMAHAMGIDSVWINQLKDTSDDTKVRELLTEFGIPTNHIVYGVCALGYAKTEGSPKEKNEDVIRFITE